ncbi:MAG TPA: MgtC/SapB family protein [Vicinamibacterales bacterium]|nr:MgtC/SapB family protein [Vicinamibacterales bacterium]
MTTNVLVIRLLLAAGLSAALGLEREYHHKPAGLRTITLIGLGSALFTMVSIAFANGGGTSDRIAAQIVTGIGFLGAGAILRGNADVHGLTTSATIWVTAAIGMAVGAGLYAAGSAAAALTLVILAVIGPVERRFERRARPRDQPRE